MCNIITYHRFIVNSCILYDAWLVYHSKIQHSLNLWIHPLIWRRFVCWALNTLALSLAQDYDAAKKQGYPVRDTKLALVVKMLYFRSVKVIVITPWSAQTRSIYVCELFYYICVFDIIYPWAKNSQELYNKCKYKYKIRALCFTTSYKINPAGQACR